MIFNKPTLRRYFTTGNSQKHDDSLTTKQGMIKRLSKVLSKGRRSFNKAHKADCPLYRHHYYQILKSAQGHNLNYFPEKQVYERLESFPKPTIAMIDGYCIGGGLNVAVCCDIRICSKKSQFAMPAAKLSLGYPFSSIKRLFDIMGPGMSKHFMFTAERILADEALSCGLVQKLVEDGNLEEFVNNYAEKIAGNAPLTIKAMKNIGIEILKNPNDRNLDECKKLAEACFDSNDYVEGRRAFMEKRKPNFKGN